MLVALSEEDPPTLHHLVVAGVAAVAGVVDCVVDRVVVAFDAFAGVADAAVLAAAVVGFLAVAAAVVVLVDSLKHSEEDPLKQLRFHSLFFSFPPLHCRQWLGRSVLP